MFTSSSFACHSLGTFLYAIWCRSSVNCSNSSGCRHDRKIYQKWEKLVRVGSGNDSGTSICENAEAVVIASRV